jgi:hypothetical protein
MQTHEDADFAAKLTGAGKPTSEEDLKALEGRAAQAMKDGTSQITAGKPGEEIISEKQVGTFAVRRLPEDPQCLRISIGEGHRIADSAYLVFRGEPCEVEDLLERALAALRVSGYLGGA